MEPGSKHKSEYCSHIAQGEGKSPLPSGLLAYMELYLLNDTNAIIAIEELATGSLASQIRLGITVL